MVMTGPHVTRMTLFHRPFASKPRTLTVRKTPKVISSLGQSKEHGSKASDPRAPADTMREKKKTCFILYFINL